MILTNDIQCGAMLHFVRCRGQRLSRRRCHIRVQFFFYRDNSALRYRRHHAWRCRTNVMRRTMLIGVSICGGHVDPLCLLTQTFWHRIAPLSVYLTHRGCVASQLHTLVTSEYDAGAKSSSCLNILQPAVVQRSRRSTIDFLACWQLTAPFAIGTTSA